MPNGLVWWAALASVLTFIITVIGAGVGVWGYIRYRREFSRKSKRLEDYLKQEKEEGKDRGQRSVLRIIRDVGLTEEEIIKMSFHNLRIARRVGSDELTGLANSLLFEYVEGEADQ